MPLTDSSETRFLGLSSEAYEHPIAQTAVTALKKIPGYDLFVKKTYGLISEPSIRLWYVSSSVRASERQFSTLYKILQDAARVLDAPKTPEVFVVNRSDVNARTIGMDRPIIVVHSALLELMNDAELRFVIGHELGHALSGHSTYQTLLEFLENYAISSAGAISAGKAAGKSEPVIDVAFTITEGVFVRALSDLSRKMELSADRAGMLVGQDLHAGIRALMKLAGGTHLHEMNTEAFLEQAAEYKLDSGTFSQIRKLRMLQRLSHPLTVMRVLELKKWVDEGDYGKILEGEYALRREYKRSAGGEVYKVAGQTRPKLTGPQEQLASESKDSDKRQDRRVTYDRKQTQNKLTGP